MSTSTQTTPTPTPAANTNGNERFNAEAAGWDSNPDVHTASAGALKAILQHFPELQEYRDGGGSAAQKGLNALEIGCGTGILSLQLAPHLHSLTAVDTASGMISAFRLKLSRPEHSSIKNVLPVCVMLEDPDDPAIQQSPLPPSTSTANHEAQPQPRRFDIIFSHLVLHHIPSLPSIFRTMYGCLKPGGWVALTDFENFGPEAQKFHPKDKLAGVERHGIKRDEMRVLLEEAGFVDVGVETAFTMSKEVEREPGAGKGSGGMMEFPFLICLGRRA